MANISLGTLSVNIGANTKGIRKGLTDTTKALKTNDKQLKANSNQWSQWSLKAVAANTALILAVGQTVRKTFEYADAFQGMTNKLRLVTDGTEQLTDVTKKLFAISNETRSSVEGTTNLYTKMFRATRDLDIGQERLLKITESVNKAFAIGGATTQEAAGSVRQLGQALASGTLRGDEFNSIAEQAPIIMEAVKAATGETAGSLRELAATGAITAEILVSSLEQYADKIDKDFAKSTATFSQKLTIANNNAIEFVSSTESVTDAVGDAGDALLFLSENLETIAEAAKIAATAYGSLLVGSLVKSTTAKIAAIAASSALAAAEVDNVAINLAVAKSNQSVAISAVEVAAAEVKAAEATLASAVTKVEKTAANHALLLSQQKLAVSVQAVGAAETRTTIATNAATVANGRLAASATLATRAVGALKWSMAALGGPIGILITAAASLALFVDWETETEKKTKLTNNAIRAQIGLMTKLSDNDLAIRLKVNTDAEARYKEQLEKTNAAIKEEQRLNAGRAGGGDVRTKKMGDLKRERATLKDHISRVTKLKDAAAIEQNKRANDADKEQQRQFDLNAKEKAEKAKKANDKLALATIERLKTESVRLQEALSKQGRAIKTHFADKLKLVEGDATATATLIKQRDAELEKLQQEHVENMFAIDVKAKEDRDKLKALTPEQEENKQRLEEIIERTKTEGQIEQERWAEEQQFLRDKWGVEAEMTAENYTRFQELKQQHIDRMKEIEDGTGNGFINDLMMKHATELELQAIQYATQQEMLEADILARKLTEGEAAAARKQLAQDNEDEITRIKQSSQRAQMGILTSGLGAMAQALQSGGEKAQKIGKKIAIARAVLAGGQAAVDAWRSGMETGGPWAPVVAAAYTAASIARTASMISSIKSNSKPSSGGGSIRTPTLPSGSPGGNGGGNGGSGKGPQRNISISLIGSGSFSGEQVRELIGQINDQTDDGVILNVTGG